MKARATPEGKASDKPGRTGKVLSVNVSRKKGQVKTPVPSAKLVAGGGIEGDAHLGFAHRQVSLLMNESVEEQRKRIGERSDIELGPGAFAENLTTQRIDLGGLGIGDILLVGERIRLRVSQIGKECHTHCAVYHLTGECIMPTLGIFCEVLEGGTVRPGDRIERL
jgi:molybdopterin adenylyltransferase